MTQQPFSRPGAIDLSGLSAPVGSGQEPGGAAPSRSAYAVVVDEQNFQGLLEGSMTAPILLVFYSPTRMAPSAQLARDIETLSAEFEGRFLAALVDVDQTPAIAQATTNSDMANKMPKLTGPQTLTLNRSW